MKDTMRNRCGGFWFLFPACLFLASRLEAVIPAGERTALMGLYTATNGASWTNNTNWNVVGIECSWHGVVCDGPGTTVLQVQLNNNNLSGTLPSLTGLPNLQLLSLDTNALTGSVPSFDGLGSLKTLLLDFNGLTSLPSLASLTSLLTLGAQGNQLTAIPALPSSLFSMDLSHNLLAGVPPLVGLSNLDYLNLSYNNLTGLPSFTTLAKLRYADLSFNQLAGSIPSLSSNALLAVLLLQYNQLSGGIPDFAGLTHLTDIFLESNQLTGGLPSFSGLPNLVHLYLFANQLSGPIPSFAGLPSLKELVLAGNSLTGPVPPIASFTGTPLQILALGANMLSGTIPSDLTGLTTLFAGGLDLRWNSLSSSDATLVAFLNSKQYLGNWQSTQTLPPTGLGTSGATPHTVTLTFTPIAYTGDGGFYQAYGANVSGGPYTPFPPTTADKTASSLTVTGLTGNTPYYFIVKTTTPPHANNGNTVVSGGTPELPVNTAFPVTLMSFTAD